MASWRLLSGIFGERQAPAPRSVEVGRADVHIVEMDGTAHDLVFDGSYEGDNPFGRGDWILSPRFYFASWQERAGKTGMLGVGGDTYVPFCNVKRITVKYSKHQIEVT